MSDATIPSIQKLWQTPSFRFIGLLIVYLLALGLGFSEGLLRFCPQVLVALAKFTAASAHFALGLVTHRVTLDGTLVSYEGFSVQIIAECVGVLEILIFAACVLAYPTRWRDKAIGLGLGIPAIYLFNIVRILCLLVVGHFYPSTFDFFHLYFWQATLILMITSLFLLWLYVVVRR